MCKLDSLSSDEVRRSLFHSNFFVEQGATTHVYDIEGSSGVSHPLHAAPCYAGAALPEPRRWCDVVPALTRCGPL